MKEQSKTCQLDFMNKNKVCLSPDFRAEPMCLSKVHDACGDYREVKKEKLNRNSQESIEKNLCSF